MRVPGDVGERRWTETGPLETALLEREDAEEDTSLVLFGAVIDEGSEGLNDCNA